MKRSRVIILCSLTFLFGSSLGYFAGVFHGCTWPSLWKEWASVFQFQSLPQLSSNRNRHYAPGLGTAGTTREETVAMLMRVKARVLTNSDEVIVAELGPEG